MQPTAIILACLAIGATTAVAGVTPAPTGKNPPPCPPVDPCAGPISYNNVELIYAHTDFDGRGFDNGDGFDVRFEYDVMRKFYITANVDYDSYDYTFPDFDGANTRGSVGFDQWTLTLGIGGHIELTSNIHLAGEAGFVYTDIDGDLNGYDAGMSGSETGWYIRPHIRAKWGCLTVHAGGSYKDLGGDDEWSFYGRLYYQVAPQWDITAGISTGDDADVYSAGVRWRF